MSDEDVQVKFGADIGEATAGIKEVTEKLEGIASPISGLMSSFGELAEAIAAAFAVEKVFSFMESMAELGTKTERTAAMLGVSTEEVGRLNAISLATGQSTDAMTRTLERLALTLQKAKDGTTPAAAGFKALSLNVAELVNLPAKDALDKIADGVSKFGDGMNKTAIAAAIFGQRLGPEMIPMLNLGSEGMSKLGEMADRAGSAMREAAVGGLHQLHVALTEMDLSFQGLKITIASMASGTFGALVTIATDVVQSFNNAIKAGGMLADTLGMIGYACKALITGLAAVIAGIEQIWAAATVLVDDLGHLFIGLGKSIQDAMHLNFTAASDDIKGIAAGAQQTMTAYLAQIKSINQTYSNEISKIWGETKIGPEAKDKPPAPKMNLDVTAGIDAAKSEMEGEIKVEEQGLALKKMILEQEFNEHKISKSKELQSLQDYTDDAYDDEREMLSYEMSLYAEGTKGYQEALNKRKELDAKYALESQKITGEVTADAEKKYQSMATSIEGAFNSQLRGLLAGTTSWGTAFKNITGDMVIKFIEACEKMVVEWAIKEAMSTTATTTGVAARTTAEASGTAAGFAISMASAVKSIMSSAAQTFAGVTAFLSPTMGPAAVGPAAAAEAAVASTAAAAYEQGTPWVPADGMAMLHRGEAVVPAAVNAAGLGGGSGGSGGGDSHIHFHGGVNDAQSLARFWKQNASNISSALAKHSAVNV